MKKTGKIPVSVLNDIGVALESYFKRKGAESIDKINFYFKEENQHDKDNGGRWMYYEFNIEESNKS